MRSSALIRFCVLAAIATAAACSPGCSPKSKLERHLANAQKFVAAGNLAAAEIEYANVQKLDPENAQAMAGLAALYLDVGSVTMALPRLAAAKQLAPDNLENRIRLARAYLGLGGVKQARDEALYVLDHRPTDGDAAQLLAESSRTPEEVAEARARITTDDAKAQVALAILALREKNLSEARKHIETALSADAKLAEAYTVLATIQLAEGNFDGAGTSLEQAAINSPMRSPRRTTYARFLISRGNVEGGRKVLDEINREAPDFLPASIMRADLAANSGAKDEALKILADVITHDPSNPEALMMRASVHLAKGDNTIAIEQLEALVTKFPDVAPMHYMLASAYASSNDPKRALSSLARTLQLAPDHIDAAILQAGLQMQTGDAASAVLGLRDVLKKQPRNSRAQILLADALRARGQNEDALKIYADAISAAPQDPMLRFYVGGLFAQLGQQDKARQAFEQALALKPDFTAAVEQLVTLDIAARNLPAAMTRVTQFVSAHDGQADAHVLVARVAATAGDTGRAEQSLRRAIEVNPEHPVAYSLLAQLYLGSNRQDEALANLQTAVEKNPRDFASLMLIGILRQQKNEPQAAREAYEKLLQINASFVPALNNLAYLYSENLGDLNRAYELSNRARELRPNDPIALDTFGWILYQRKEYAWALSLLSDSGSKLPDNGEVQYHLGMVRYVLGDEPGARAALSYAANAKDDFAGKEKARACLAVLEIDPVTAGESALADLRKRVAETPDDPIALSRLATILARRGKTDEALAAYEAVVKAHPENAIALVNLARFLATRPDGLTRAMELARNAYKIAPDNVTVLHLVGSIAYQNGDYPWAASLLGTAARRVPDSAAIQWDLARAVYAVGQTEDAVAAAKAALSSGPGFAQAGAAQEFVDLASAAQATTLAPAAVGQAETVQAADPRNVPALMVSVRAAVERDDMSAALDLAGKALAVLPKFSPALKVRALVLARESPSTPGALEAGTKAREALPNDPEVAAALGTIHFRRGEFARAATLLSEAVRAPRVPAEVHFMLGMCQKQAGDKDRSRASLQRALDLGLSGESADTARAALAAP